VIERTKGVAARALDRVGYRITRVHRPDEAKRYAPSYAAVFPEATYSPWLTDERFRDAYRIARSHTLVDWYRLFELWQLAAEVAPFGGDYLEVGSWRGGSAALIAARARVEAPSAMVFACDSFRGVVKAGARDTAYKGGEHADTSPEVVRGLFERLALTNAEVLEGVFPEETGEALADRHFGMVHVDVDVYESAHDVLSWAWPRLADGGIVVFDDYGFLGCEGVTALVDDQRKRSDRVVVHNLNGHGIVLKLSS
jgi:O-methyltransferase